MCKMSFANSGGKTSPGVPKLYVADPRSPGVEEGDETELRASSSLRRSALSPAPQKSTILNNGSSPAGAQTINIRSLIAQKEKELHEINDYRVSTLEEELRRREKAEVTVRAKFGKLKEDFMYNLKLIEDRDAELDRYEANFESLKGVIRSKDNELNELRTEVADVKSQLDSERSRAKANDSHYETKLRDMTESLEKSKWAQEDDERRHREALDACKRDLAQQLRTREAKPAHIV